LSDSAWKKFERAVARWFGCERTGPMQGKDASDIDHDRLHVQCKHGKRHAILTVWDAAKTVAGRAGKIPVVAIKQSGRYGFWLLVKESDLIAVAAEVASANLNESGERKNRGKERDTSESSR